MSISVDHTLQEALREFQSALTPDQYKQLQAVKAFPDAAAVITFTAQLDEQNAKRRACGVATRLYTLLQSIQQFSSVVSTLVSSHPSIAALVWGSVKLTMLVRDPGHPIDLSLRQLNLCLGCVELHVLL